MQRPRARPTFFDHYLGGEPFDGEWWPTGDQVREDEDGYLWFEGRDDDMILSAGYRIGPFEVESALVSATRPSPRQPRSPHPTPSAARSCGRSSSCATASPPSALAAELQEHVKSVTAPYKYPRIVEFADELPKTSSGKIRRAELRGLLRSRPFVSTHAHSSGAPGG